MNTTVADLQLVKVLLDSDLSAYQIEAKTGITRTAISKYRTGKSDVLNMPMQTAIALTNFSDNQIKIVSGELLDRMKHSSAFQYVIRTSKSFGTYLKDDGTNNYQEIYNNKDDGHYYGVYGQAIGGQIDSRTHTDEQIKDAIQKILTLGNIVPRKSLPEAD